MYAQREGKENDDTEMYAEEKRRKEEKAKDDTEMYAHSTKTFRKLLQDLLKR
jgi:hypothetical protein